MGKIYFRDVSRRLLLFTFLLLGVAFSAIADNHYVSVFRETPYSDGSGLIKSGTLLTEDNINLKVYQSTITTSDDLSTTYSSIVGKYWEGGNVAATLGLVETNLLPTPDAGFVLQNRGNAITQKTEIRLKSNSYGAGAKRYYILLENNNRVKAFGKFAEGSSQSDEILMGHVNAVVNEINLPSAHEYTFSASDAKAEVTALQAALLADLKTAFGVDNISSIKIMKNGVAQSGRLAEGAYTYYFDVVTPADQAFSVTAVDGRANISPTTINAGETVTVGVGSGINVTSKEVVTVPVPTKEVFSYYAGVSEANVNQLSAAIANQINAGLTNAGLSLSVSNVRILKNGIAQAGDLEANPYSYSFVLNPNTSVKEILFQRVPDGTIDVVVNGTETTVTVKNSIEINPVFEASVFSANYTPVSAQVQSEVALKNAILAGLVKKNEAFNRTEHISVRSC